MVEGHTACEICPLSLPNEGEPCYPTREQIESLSIAVRAEVAPCFAERLNETRRDDLTGLDTYKTFREKLKLSFEHRRASDLRAFSTPEGEVMRHSGGVIFIDADNVHALDKELGHSTVDNGLKNIAQVLRDTLRDGDLCCRRSGDEYIVYLPGKVQEVSIVAGRLEEALKAGVPIDQANKLTASTCIVHDNEVASYEQVELMIAAADEELGRLKRLRGTARD